MVVVGTRPEYLNSTWVKNEWSRYLALMKQDRKRLLIPCYRDMDPYDLPEQLAVLQSYDMSRIGFLQDLIRGIAKVLDGDKKPENRETVIVQGEGGVNLTALLKRGQMALEDRDWAKADEFFDQALNLDAECAQAYWGKALAAARQNTARGFISQILAGRQERTEQVEACPPDRVRIEAAVEKYQLPPLLTGEAIRAAFDALPRTYPSVTASRQATLEALPGLLDRNKLFVRAERYARGELAAQLAEVRTGLIQRQEQSLDQARQEDGKKAAETARAYAAGLDQVEQSLARQRAEGEEQLRREAEQQAQAARRRARNRVIAAVAGAAVVLLAAVAVVVTQVIIPGNQYRDAEALLEAGEYDEAQAAFETLGDYRDASDRARHVPYQQAEDLAQAGQIAQAAIAFGKLGNYQDAHDRSLALWDQIAVRQTLDAGNSHTVALLADGTAVAAGDNRFGECDVGEWTDLVAVSAGSQFTLGLRSDGTVLGTGDTSWDRRAVNDWEDIVAVDTGYLFMVGLHPDGTVEILGEEDPSTCRKVENWTDIVAVSTGGSVVVGLRADGTVAAVGDNTYGQCDVSAWTDIVALSAGTTYSLGLKSDGTVVMAGTTLLKEEYADQKIDVSQWTDVAAVAAGSYHALALKGDGTAAASGLNSDGRCEVTGWTGIRVPD